MPPPTGAFPLNVFVIMMAAIAITRATKDFAQSICLPLGTSAELAFRNRPIGMAARATNVTASRVQLRSARSPSPTVVTAPLARRVAQ
jgi:hypothetical protein